LQATFYIFHPKREGGEVSSKLHASPQVSSKLGAPVGSWSAEMPFELVDGERRVHILEDEAAYRAYVNASGLKMSNMLELIGVGLEGKRAVLPKEKYKHMLLKNVIVVRSSASDAAEPLVGSYTDMYGILTSEPYKVSFAYKTVRDLLNDSKKKITEQGGTVWTKVKSPITRRFADGDSIVGYTVDELCTISLPHFGSRPAALSATAVESADRPFSATAGSRQVSLGGLSAPCAPCTRIEPLPRPNPSTWRRMRADRVRDRFSRAGERDDGRVRRSTVLGNRWESAGEPWWFERALRALHANRAFTPSQSEHVGEWGDRPQAADAVGVLVDQVLLAARLD